MPRIVRTLMLVVIAGAWCMALRADQPTSTASPVTLQIQDEKVVASGLTPGGTVIWFGVGRQREGWSTHVYHWLSADTAADASGQATFQPKGDLPVKSIWVAADFATGGFAASSPPTYPWGTQVPFPTNGLGLAADRKTVASLQDTHEELEVIVLRPHGGAWYGRFHRDDTTVAVGEGARVTFADLQPIAKGPTAPGSLGSGDVVIAIDPVGMHYFAQQLAGH